MNKLLNLASLRQLCKFSQDKMSIKKFRTKSISTHGLNRPITSPYAINDFVADPSSVSYEAQKENLTPHQQYLIETRSMERAMTGMFWADQELGFYHCVVCNSRIFSFDTKFDAKTGYATFWRAIKDRVRVVDEQNVTFDHVNYTRNKADLAEDVSYKRCECAQCNSHLGVVYFDGPPPTFLRFSINSSLLKFQELPQFEDPNIARRAKAEAEKSKVVKYIR